MLKRYATAAAVAALLVPAVTRADIAPASQSFVIRGCADNLPIAYTGTDRVFGRLACFFGTGTFTRATTGPFGPDLYTFEFTGGLNTTLGTDQTRGFHTEVAPTLTLTSPRAAPVQIGIGSFFNSVGFGDGYTTPLDGFGYAMSPLTLSDYTGGTLDFYVHYTLNDSPRMGTIPSDWEDSGPVSLTVTATPEPASLALTAVALGGLAVLGAGVRRRRVR